MHVYRWDLDRTYLDTDIHSVRGMVRAALEPAASKLSIPGAPPLLRGLVEHDPSTQVTIISGSPLQMRPVLEAKLALDGIRVDALVLKDNLRNIRRGRFRAVRGQVGYKLPQLLALRLACPADTTESLFGDDAEVDALVYALYADAIAGRVLSGTLTELMVASGAYEDQIEHALRSLRRLEPADAVQDIFIHVDRGLPLKHYGVLGPKVHVVFSWMQAAWVLWRKGRLSTAHVADVVEACSPEAATHHSHPALAAVVQDAIRRSLISATDVEFLWQAEPRLYATRPSVDLAIGWLGTPPVRDADHGVRDWQAFLHASREVALAGTDRVG